MARKKAARPPIDSFPPAIELARPSIDDIEKAMAATDGTTVSLGTDGVALISAAHPGSLSDDAIEETEIEIKNERFDAAVAKAVAAQIATGIGLPIDQAAARSGWLAGVAAALAIARDECDTESARENGQAWANCARQIADRIAALEVPS